MNDSHFIALQRLVPQHLLSRLAGRFADTDNAFIKDRFIRWFAERYGVDMSEAMQEDLAAYPSFNAFFTRALKPGARPICQDAKAVVSPADGIVSQLGEITEGRIFQAKGQEYTVNELLGGDEDTGRAYQNGHFATIYLSPKDYHRVHMPADGTLTHTVYVPGALFSVNTVTAEHVPRLFARNERLVCHFEGPFGPFVLILVGAMIVASIETTWAGVVTPIKRRIQPTYYGEQSPIAFAKGDEMGRFLLGSTAIVLHPPGVTEWDQRLAAGSKVQMGEKIGSFVR